MKVLSRLFTLLILCALFVLPGVCFAQATVDVNFDLKHVVGQVDSFDREKFIVLHAAASENDYNDQLDKLEILMTNYDTYFGRETGRMRFLASRTDEDPLRSGFATESSIVANGNSLNQNYGRNTGKHRFEKGRVITAAQTTPFYPNGFTPVNPQDPADEQWFFSSTDSATEPFGSATGQYMGQFVRHGYGTGGVTGPPRPSFVEVMNEPVWPLVDVNLYGGGTLDDIFKMHLTIADSIRAYSPESLVGGYCTAFPDFEKPGLSPGNSGMFGQWEERWKRFVDEAGPKMDFYALHFYDFPSIRGGLEQNRKGANMEATLDMLEHYNTLQYGKVKPLVISEYGSQLNDFYQERWSPARDWYIIKAFNAMMMQFMERPDVIQKTVPFTLAKADFFFGGLGPELPYPWRMLRRANEPDSYTGDWVFTEVVKFYELWANVHGTRVETRSSDPDLLVDAYVAEEDNKAYLIIHNIDEDQISVDLASFGLSGIALNSVRERYLFLDEGTNRPRLTNRTLSAIPEVVTIAEEGTIILEIDLASPLAIDETAREEKIYATTYKQAISSNQPVSFTIPGLVVGPHGEAVLRLGVGRPLSASRQPVVTINGNPLTVSDDYRGDDQRDRDVFFGVLEVAVANDLLQNGDNTVSVTFPDAGGFVSSVALQKFDFSRPVIRTVAEDRDRSITFANREAFIPDGTTLPVFSEGASFTAQIAYATGVLDSIEEDLHYVAMQIRQVDENFNVINTSAFEAVVNEDSPNAAEVAIEYTLPITFNDGSAIPITAELPTGHKMLLLIFMSVNNDSGFADANSEIIINPKPDRQRKLTFTNRADFIPVDSLLPQFTPGQNFRADLQYSTGIANGVEEDLQYVAMQVRQVNENFDIVNSSTFQEVVNGDAANLGEVTIDYTLPVTFDDGTDIPLTADLPDGHKLLLLIFMSVDEGASFADANTEIVISRLADRARSIAWTNKEDFIPTDSIRPQFLPGETYPISISYSTGIVNEVEEDLNYVALNIRQVDENGALVAESFSEFIANNDDNNSGQLSVNYQIPTIFNEGSTIPTSLDLPEGHELLLLVLMSVDGDTGFADDNTVINLTGTSNTGDRERAISWRNKNDYRPGAEAPPTFAPGQTFSMRLTYSTAKVGETEEDLQYVAMMLRQVDAQFNIVKTSQFMPVVNTESANFDDLTFDYTLPTAFDDGSAIPESVDLPEGHQLLLLVFMSVNNDTGFADDNTSIVLDGSVSNSEVIDREILNLFPNPTVEALTLATTGELKNIRVEVLNLLGSSLFYRQFDHLPATVTIPMDVLPTGNYFLRISNNDGIAVRQFVKK